MIDRPNNPLRVIGWIARLIFDICIVILAGVGVGALVYWLAGVLL